MVQNAVLYVRISELTDASTSPERQLQDARDYAARNGLDVVAELEDLDVSGRRGIEQRPGLTEALELIEDGRAAFLIVARLDRLARSIITFHEAVQRIEQAGGAFVSVAEGLDFSTPAGRMVASVLASFAQYESELIGQRVASARRHLREVGKWPGGRRPFGWLPEPHESGSGFVLKLHPTEAPVLREMAQKVLSGIPLHRIARDLNEAGVKTVLGKDWSSGHSVRQALTKDAIVGRYGAEPLLSVQDYHRVQTFLQDRPEPASRREDLDDVLLPPELISCGRCGAPMKRGTHGKDGRAWTVYRCSSRRAPGSAAPCFLLVSAARVDEVVEERILETLGRFPVSVMAEPELIDPAADERAELEAAIRLLEEDRYIRGLYAGADGDRRFLELYAALEARIDDLPKPFLTESNEEPIPTGELAIEVWQNSDIEDRRAWVEAVVLDVVIAPGKPGKRFDSDRVAIRLRTEESP